VSIIAFRNGWRNFKASLQRIDLLRIFSISHLIQKLSSAHSLSKTVKTASIKEEKEVFHSNLTIVCGLPWNKE